MRHGVARSAIFLAVFLAIGCYHPPGRQLPVDTALPHPDPLPRFAGAEAADPELPPEYRLGRGDTVRVTVDKHPEFSGDFKVDRDGGFEVPVAERRVRAEGRTVMEAESAVRDLIAPFTRAVPKVRVELTAAQSQFYYLYGAINSQGRFPMGEDVVDLRRAVIDAGLWAEGAAPWKTHIITPDPDEPTFVVVDARDVLYGKTRENIVIKPGDVIFVPTSAYSLFNRTLDEILNEVHRGASADLLYQYMEQRLSQGGANVARGGRGR